MNKKILFITSIIVFSCLIACGNASKEISDVTIEKTSESENEKDRERNNKISEGNEQVIEGVFQKEDERTNANIGSDEFLLSFPGGWEGDKQVQLSFVVPIIKFDESWEYLAPTSAKVTPRKAPICDLSGLSDNDMWLYRKNYDIDKQYAVVEYDGQTVYQKDIYLDGQHVLYRKGAVLPDEKLERTEFVDSALANKTDKLPKPPEEWFEIYTESCLEVKMGDNVWYKYYFGRVNEEDEILTSALYVTGTGKVRDVEAEIQLETRCEDISVDAFESSTRTLSNTDEEYISFVIEIPFSPRYIVIEEGITELGDFSFSVFKYSGRGWNETIGVEAPCVFFPNSLERIGKGAFYGWYNKITGCGSVGYNLNEDVELDDWAFGYDEHYDRLDCRRHLIFDNGQLVNINYLD